jgi:hypothetical protein
LVEATVDHVEVAKTRRESGDMLRRAMMWPRRSETTLSYRDVVCAPDGVLSQDAGNVVVFRPGQALLSRRE